MEFQEQLEKRLVAPLVGAWIEIQNRMKTILVVIVAPLVGAWIEIIVKDAAACYSDVAPLVGAWIEIYTVSGETNLIGSLLL